jgi:hypothetical protein
VEASRLRPHACALARSDLLVDGDAEHAVAGGQAREPLGPLGRRAGGGEGNRGHHAAREERDGCGGGAERLRDHHRVEHLEARSSVLRGDQRARGAQLGELPPQRGVVPGVEGGQLAHARDGELLAQEAPQGGLEQALLLRQPEVHRYFPSPRGSRGSPSPRSAMMFFWICAVPPPMIMPSENMCWKAQLPPARS